MNDTISTILPEPMLRCAIYTCSDSTLARRADSEDQERICRRAIDSLGMLVEEQFVVSDVRRSARSPRTNEGLNDLLAAAKQSPSPFEFIFMDDTACVGRDSLVLKIYQTLKDHEVNLYFVSQKLDSRDKNFEFMLTLSEMMKEQFVAAHGRAVTRGMRRKGKGREANG